jgi:hypothetical protein
MIFDQGGEFDNAWMYTLCKRWNITPEPDTIKNPRVNAIVNPLHKLMGDMLPCALAQRHLHDNPVVDLLLAAAHGVRATVASQHYEIYSWTTRLLHGHDLENAHRSGSQDGPFAPCKATQTNNQLENERQIKYNY